MPEKVTLGDGHNLDAVGRGMVALVVKLPDGKRQRSRLRNVLLVPDLSHNLLSVSKVSDAGMVIESCCQIRNSKGEMRARATCIL